MDWENQWVDTSHLGLNNITHSSIPDLEVLKKEVERMKQMIDELYFPMRKPE